MIVIMANESLSLLPISQWISNGPNDSFQLHDPVSGDPIKPSAPPEFLLQDYRLNEGRIHIAGERLGGMALIMYYSDGESSADDLGPVDREMEDGATFEDVVAQVQSVGYLTDGLNHEMELMRVESGLLTPNYTSSGSPYLDRITRAIIAGRAFSFCAGLEVEPTGQPSTTTEQTLEEISKIVQQQAHDETDAGAGYLASRVIHRNTMQWYRVLMTGYRLGTLLFDRHSHAEVGDISNVMVITSIREEDTGRKFTSLGMGNQAYGGDYLETGSVRDNSTFDPVLESAHWDADVMKLGRIPVDMLEEA